METKWCPKCEIEKPITDFTRNKGRLDGLTPYCRLCHRAVCLISRKQKRQTLIVTLGGKCACCGYDKNWNALQIDHVKGNGATERRSGLMPHTVAFREKVLAHPEDYQLLCANCNQIKRIEKAEHVGKRIYNRIAPTLKIVKSEVAA